MQTIITIGREYGSGGYLIAQKLAEKLGIPYYDKELIEIAAKETGLSEKFIKEVDQKRTTSFLYNLYFSAQNLPLSDQVFIAQSEIIKSAAAKGPCVIVGRCADYVLRENPHCLHVFIHAPLEKRVARVRDVYGANIGDRDLRHHILKQDKARAAYYNHFTAHEWHDLHNYHITIDSELGENTVVDIIERLIQDKENIDAIRE